MKLAAALALLAALLWLRRRRPSATVPGTHLRLVEDDTDWLREDPYIVSLYERRVL